MSVYSGDRDEWIKESIDSLLVQSYRADIFIAVDGNVTNEVIDTLKGYEAKHDNIKIQFYETNEGLATRLNDLIDTVLSSNVLYKYIARMDADDVALPHRIESQVNFLEDNSEISVVGSSVIEVDEYNSPLFTKIMADSHDDLAENIIRKCPFNHPTVVFRSSVFLSGFRYLSGIKNTQDYYLWVQLLSNDYKFSNLKEPLLYFRVSNDFHKKRGVKKAINEFNARVYAMKTLSKLSVLNVVFTVSLLLIRVSPKFISKFAYRYMR
ncbi:glycosyl transferase [Vibrio harveyi]|nr:glycosyl transferase [Vibrio harveyi]